MIADNLKEGPLTLEEVGLILTSKINPDKLIFQGLIQKNGIEYIGYLSKINVDFDNIQKFISDKKVEIFTISENLIKLKIGGTSIELVQKPKMEDENHTETKTIQKLLKTQSLMEQEIKQQNDELQQYKTLINELQMGFNDFKQTIKLCILSQESLKEKVVNLSSQTEERLTAKIESRFDTRYKELEELVNKKKESEKNDAMNEDKIEEMKNQINELKKEISEFKHNLEDKMSHSLKVDKASELEKPDLYEKMQENAKKKEMIKLALNKKFELVSARLNANSILIDDLKRELRRQNDELKKTENTVTQQSDQLKQHENKIEETSKTVSEKSNELKQHENKLNELRSYLEGEFKCQLLKLIRFESSWEISRLNEPIRSCKWSEQLKPKEITINNNVVTKTNEKYYDEFCLLNASFSNTIKEKQSWAIQIKKTTGFIRLGVCLKSKMIEYNFISRNIKSYKTGHGLFVISSGGFCYSHEYKEFNFVYKSFKFGVDDVIYMEYDPIDSKLRFSKNLVDYFEMPIIAPPENDAYHPCVELCRENDSVELIQP